MSKMTTCLWFDHGKAREAAEFYASVFPDRQVGEGHAGRQPGPVVGSPAPGMLELKPPAPPPCVVLGM